MDILRSLSIVKVIRYKSRQWNQTNYYNLDYKQLQNWAKAESIEISELCNSTPQNEENQTLDLRNNEVSLYEPKITTKERTTKQRSDLLTNKSDSIAAATPKTALEARKAVARVPRVEAIEQEEERSQKNNNPHSAGITASPGQKKQESGPKKSNPNEETNVAKVDYIINEKWEKLIPLLDSAGIPINKTIEDLLKLHPKEKVEGALKD